MRAPMPPLHRNLRIAGAGSAAAAIIIWAACAGANGPAIQDSGAGIDMAMTSRTDVAATDVPSRDGLPPIDARAPSTIETATFALG